MTMKEIQDLARNKGIRPGTRKKSELVRAIQAEEGNNRCFDTGFSDWCSHRFRLRRGAENATGEEQRKRKHDIHRVRYGV